MVYLLKGMVKTCILIVVFGLVAFGLLIVRFNISEFVESLSQYPKEQTQVVGATTNNTNITTAVLPVFPEALISLYDNNNMTNRTQQQQQQTPSRIVWQTFWTKELPESVQKVRGKMNRRNKGYDFRLYDDDDVQNFMKEHFSGTRVYQAFQSINPKLGAMKADFWRYCVLYVYGGVYLDMDSIILLPLRRWVNNQFSVLSFEGNVWEGTTRKQCLQVWKHIDRKIDSNFTLFGPDNNTTNLFVQWALVFPFPGNPILKEVILFVTDLLLEWKDTPQSLNETTMKSRVVCLTGPSAFTVAVQGALKRNEYPNLQFRGYDYEKSILCKKALVQKALDQLKPRYDSLPKNIPVLVAP
mmetsp:Transcript_9464/g.14602  ORF Transcript_9464/g.14602 Transcript_9464/m.14602 type:complete len:355 (+) Transcript_9464:91-1155(+)